MKYVILFAVILGLVFAGCSGSNTTSQTAPTTQQTTTDSASASSAPVTNPAATGGNSAPLETLNPAVDVSATTTVTTSVPTATTSAAAADLKKLIGTGVNLHYQVHYAYTASGPATVSGTMSQYFSGLTKMRFDTTMQGIESQTYIIDGGFTSCTKFSGAWNCFTSSGSESNMSYSAPSTELETSVDSSTVESLPSRTIAGAKTSCFKVTQDVSTVEYCYSSDAVPLYVKTNGVDSASGVTSVTTLEATSYSTTVGDDLFVAPKTDSAAMTNPADLMKQYQMPG